MKTTVTLLAMALCTSLAQAASFSLPNQGGGLIIITDRPCPDQVNGKGLLEAYATLPDGSRLEGCWALFDGLVQIGWGQGRQSSLDPQLFQRQGEPSSRPEIKKNKLSL